MSTDGPGDGAVGRARDALDQAKADARARGSVPGGPARRRRSASGRRARLGDPQSIADALGGLLAAQGWEQRAAVGAVFGRWEQIVGSDLAAHSRPEGFEDGEVVVVADSPAWATQLRLLAGVLVRRLNEELGHGAVRAVRVTGGSTPGGRRSAS